MLSINKKFHPTKFASHLSTLHIQQSQTMKQQIDRDHVVITRYIKTGKKAKKLANFANIDSFCDGCRYKKILGTVQFFASVQSYLEAI